MTMYPPFHALDPAWSPETVAVLAGRPAAAPGAPMNVPIVLSSTYRHDAEVGYGRDGNVGWGALEEALGVLEGGEAIAFASGLAAAQAVAELVPVGGIVVLPNVAYYGVRMVFQPMEDVGRIAIRWVDPADTDAVIAACVGASMVWMESVANPAFVVPDLPAIAAAARAAGALTVVDATFATPLRQRPLAFGVDIVVHSATKYIGGHSDLLLGVAIASAPAHAQRLWQHRHDRGAVPGALEAYLALRGLRTMAVRLERAEANAGELALRLQAHPRITRVLYPGLPTDPNHAVASRVMQGGYGAMLSFEVDGSVEQVEHFLASLHLITHATSLGGVETLIERRARYAADAVVVPASLCRLSVGIEHIDDIWNDIEHALGAAFAD